MPGKSTPLKRREEPTRLLRRVQPHWGLEATCSSVEGLLERLLRKLRGGAHFLKKSLLSFLETPLKISLISLLTTSPRADAKSDLDMSWVDN
jgi:hypothetical protein